MSREEALKFLKEQIENKNIIKHMIACEVIMRALAKRFEPGKEEVWAMAGLLHDGDYRDDVPPDQQGIKVSQMLEARGFQIPEEMKQTMAAHNWGNTGVEPKSKMDWSLFCGDSLTGLIVATALVHPERKLARITVESILKKFKDKAFARGTRRKEIALCEEKLGIPLNEFMAIGLKAMQDAADELGL
ncbi:MAG: phosphohydrolase [Candidatus Pacebacteria bacterium]|nr:phosphohydrolase [Candidatus Paceibacterota bacterium]